MEETLPVLQLGRVGTLPTITSHDERKVFIAATLARNAHFTKGSSGFGEPPKTETKEKALIKGPEWKNIRSVIASVSNNNKTE